METRIKYSAKKIIALTIIFIVTIFATYFAGVYKSNKYGNELTLLRESKTLQDSAIAFVSLIMPESTNKFDSAAIYSRIDKNSREYFKFNYEYTLKNGIKDYIYIKNRIQILKIIKPFYIKKVEIEKDEDVFNVVLKMRTVSYKEILTYFALKDTSYTYEKIYIEKNMSMNYKKRGGKFYFIGFAY